MPQLSLELLKLLKVLLDAPAQQHYGLELAAAAGLRLGSIYPMLTRLERWKWIEGAWEDADPSKEKRPPRRYYRLTPLGVTSAQAALKELEFFADDMLGWKAARGEA